MHDTLAPPLPANPSGPPADTAPAASPAILVWDLPVRLFHGLMAFSFAGAWLTAESERWRLLHVTLGYTLAGLIVFRVLWGLVGTRHARFGDFVRGPRAVRRYLGALLHGRPEHHVGHNPAGALAILAMLGLGALIVASGWAVYDEVGGEWLEELHEGAATAMLAVVAVHIVGVLLASHLHHENLAAAMLTGRKAGPPDQAIRSAWRSVGVLMLAAVIGFWGWQWQARPVADGGPGPQASLAQPGKAAGQAAGRQAHGRHPGHDGDDDDDGG